MGDLTSLGEITLFTGMTSLGEIIGETELWIGVGVAISGVIGGVDRGGGGIQGILRTVDCRFKVLRGWDPKLELELEFVESGIDSSQLFAGELLSELISIPCRLAAKFNWRSVKLIGEL